MNARRGEYVDRNEITVSEYLDDWIEDHALEIKPETLEDYRITIRLYIKPHIGKTKLQAVRPSTITKLYRDLLARVGAVGSHWRCPPSSTLTRFCGGLSVTPSKSTSTSAVRLSTRPSVRVRTGESQA
ncbi:N-terminal phage integrase SAM-like domain-containing protein [Streptosporangium sp. CA-115845]|uniref:N-terminal phage integrase SAM-like domain-containing protein n=1 Tax=Streptosporangium sp. CA-115845 TaxID=3240071 RepID=UPI003D8FB8A2